ncbi:MAG: hypothetical protein K1X81_01955 [Bacteroidia bacterium]|nr:hypothetical protein [Bacteroidia bacterium]
MQNWKDLYLEIADKLAEIEGIKWVDLWHNQITFLDDEHEFPTPAIFLAFRTIATEDAGQKLQTIRLQVEAYLYYETFADTYKDSVNQDSALAFLEHLNSIYAKLHATTGDNYSEMRRTGFNPVDTGGAGNLYLTMFECNLVDAAAFVEYEQSEELEVTPEKPDEPLPDAEPQETGLPEFVIPD